MDGEFDDKSIQQYETQYALSVGKKNYLLYGEYTYKRIEGDELDNDSLIRVGGAQSTFENDRTNPLQVFDPTMTEGLLVGRYYQQRHYGLSLYQNVVSIFHRMHRVGVVEKEWSDWAGVTGIQLSSQIMGWPVPELRGLSMDIGLAKIRHDVVST